MKSNRKSLLMTLKQIIEGTHTRIGKSFDVATQGLIILSVVTFTVETLPDLDQTTAHILRVIEVVTVAIFTGEYLLRLLAAEKKLTYIVSFYGLIDVLAILPFYIASGIDLRAIRILRLFRLFRMFKLLRYSRAIHRFRGAFLEIKEELTIFMVATGFLLYLASVGIYFFENEAQPENFKSIFHCMWWAVATITTVGYGDVFPVTIGGKLFTFLVLFISLGVIAVPSGLIASALTSVLKEKEHDR